MKHLKKHRIFGRRSNQRKALMRSLAFSFLAREKITTTEAKAKSLRPYVEKLITRAKNPTLATQRLLREKMPGKIVKKLVAVAEGYKTRPGGYTRITKLGIRPRDSARMAMIELVK